LQQTSGGQRERLFHIEITNEDDPFFLFTLDVNEADFHELKTDQSLLVDFMAFPTKFIELLESCLQELVSSGESAPSFLAVLDTQTKDAHSSLLSIVETNKFKHLTHLSLRFTPGNDASIKAYLAARLQQTKAENAHLNTELRISKSEGAARGQREEAVSEELQKVSQLHQAEVSELKLKLVRDVASKNEEASSSIDTLQRSHANSLAQQRAQSEKTITELQARAEESAAKIQELSEGFSEHSKSAKSLQSQLSQAKKDRDAMEKEVVALRSESKQGDTQRFTSEKKIHQLDLEIAALRQQVQDKEELSSKTAALFESTKAQRQSVEESLRLYKANHSKMQSKLETSIAEINKGNQIIAHLQSEMRELKSKLRWKGGVIKQQEQLLEERERAMAAQESKVSGVQSELVASTARVQQLHAKLETAGKNLQEREKLLRNNQQVIDFLNNEINESQMGRQASMTGVTQVGGVTATSLGSPLSFRPSRHSAELLEQQMLSQSRTRSTPSHTSYLHTNEAGNANERANTYGYSGIGAGADLSTSGVGRSAGGLADMTNQSGLFLPAYKSPKVGASGLA
jgi:spindle assembly abnormal protein 6